MSISNIIYNKNSKKFQNYFSSFLNNDDPFLDSLPQAFYTPKTNNYPNKNYYYSNGQSITFMLNSQTNFNNQDLKNLINLIYITITSYIQLQDKPYKKPFSIKISINLTPNIEDSKAQFQNLIINYDYKKLYFTIDNITFLRKPKCIYIY